MEICGCVLNLFDSLPKNGKPAIDQYTVLSGIVARIEDESSSNSSSSLLLPICLCTGTKCLSHNSPGFQQGITLSDSHAEVLARRSLVRYLLLVSIEVVKDPSLSTQNTCPLILTSTNKGKKLTIKENWSWWLYISDSPCGSASIYERITPERSFTGKKSRAVESSLEQQQQQPQQNSNESVNENEGVNESERYQTLLRSKPGRIDIQDCRRSSSMSCSDKICRWSCLGLQGALLSKFLTNSIFLSGIVISEDVAGKGQSEALEQALTNRLTHSFNLNQSLLHPVIPQVCLTSLQFQSGKCFLENQSYQTQSEQINEDNNEPQNNNLEKDNEDNEETQSKKKKKRRNTADDPYAHCSKLKSCSTNINWIRGFGSSKSQRLRDVKKVQCQGGTVEVTLANTGRLQGSTISKSTRSYESRLCRSVIGRLCLELEMLLQQEEQKQQQQEQQEQERSILYSEYKRINTEHYYQCKKEFLENNSFKDWQVDDPELTENFPLIFPSYSKTEPETEPEIVRS